MSKKQIKMKLWHWTYRKRQGKVVAQSRDRAIFVLQDLIGKIAVADLSLVEYPVDSEFVPRNECAVEYV